MTKDDDLIFKAVPKARDTSGVASKFSYLNLTTIHDGDDGIGKER
ncbi:hypothetical protein VSK90_07495 [Bacillus swezeyi]